MKRQSILVLLVTTLMLLGTNSWADIYYSITDLGTH